MERPDFVPEEYDFAINQVIANFEAMNGPKFKGYIKIIVRPAGTRSLRFGEIYCTDKDENSHQRIFKQFCELLLQAKNEFGVKDFIFEIVNKRGDLLKEIRLNVARKIQAIMPPAEVKVTKKDRPSVKIEAPVVEPKIVEKPVVAAPVESTPVVPAPVVAESVIVVQTPKLTKADRNVVPKISDAPFELIPCPNLEEPIDFGLIRFWPNDPSSSNIRKVFGACGIETFQQMFELLGTFEPTKIEWEKFIQKLQAGANAKGIKLGSSAEGTLYWWLGKNKRWIRPYSVPARSR